MTRTAAGLMLVLLLAGPVRAVSPLELIPADALGGVAVRNLNDLKKKGDDFIREAGLNVPLRPSEAFEQILTFLGIRAGLDADGSAAVVLVNKDIIGEAPTLRNLDKYIVVAIPFDDLERMASNFGIERGQLQPEKLTPIRGQRDFGSFCYVRDKHFLLGNHEKAILSVARGRPVAREVDDARRKTLNQSDLLIHLGTEAWKDFLRNLDNGFDDLSDEAERRTAKQFVQSLGSVRFALGSVRLDGGLGVSLLTVLPKEGAETARQFLTMLRAGDGAATLRGLPGGNVVAATASRGDGTQNAVVARLILQYVLKNVLETNKLLGASDRPAVMAVFSEIWLRLQGSRFALYKTANEDELGLFSLIGILDAEDGRQFLNELKQLARLGSPDGLDLTTEAGRKATEAEIEQIIKDLGHRRFTVRESAAARLALAGEPVLPYLEKAIDSNDLEVGRRAERIKQDIVQAAEARRRELLSGELTRGVKPSFAFLDERETIAGHEVHLVAVRLQKKDAAVAPQLRQLFGPDWNRVRLVIHGRQVILLVGSDVKLFADAIRNVKENSPGLASSKTLAGQAKQVDPARKLELHVSVEMGAALAMAEDLKKPGKVSLPPPLSSMALTVETDRLQVDVWLPLSEIKIIGKAGGWE